MAEEIQKKGMSKGCMVALIVVGVLFIMVVIAGVTCWMKKDALVKYGVKTAVLQIGSLAAKNPQPGVDTTMINSFVTEFTEKLDADTAVNLELLAVTIQKIQYIPQDEMIDSIEAIEMIKTLSEIYPELSEFVPPVMEEIIPDSSMIEETTESE